MAQVITQNSTVAQVQTEVLKYVFTDTDGSRRVNVDGLSAFLAEQFSFLPASGIALTTKSAQAATIANNLQQAMGREAFRTRIDYPRGEVATVNVEAQNKLITLRDAIQDDARKINIGYNAFFTRIGVVLQALFNTSVAESIVGTKLVLTSRAYIETFVTDRGEESRPSAPSAVVSLDQNDYAVVTCSAPPAGRFVTKRRLYRTATGNVTSSYRLQGEYPIATTVITDPLADNNLAADSCTTFGWLEPPATLSGLAGMSNGIMLGFVGSTLHACEPYVPYAWPAAYDKPLPHKITGIVSLGQSALVGTTGYPYLVSGSDSAGLTEQKLPNLVPCASARSMVAIGNSVFYAGNDGLALYENGQVAIVTEGIIDRVTWAGYNPTSMFGIGFDGRYFAFYTKAGGARGCLVFDYKGRSISELSQQADAAFASEAGAYVLDGLQVLDMLPTNGTNRTGKWKSKVFRLAEPQAMLWLHVDAQLPASVIVRIFANGTLHHSATVTSAAPVRVPPGRFTRWQAEVESASIVSGVVLTSSTKELKAVL